MFTAGILVVSAYLSATFVIGWYVASRTVHIRYTEIDIYCEQGHPWCNGSEVVVYVLLAAYTAPVGASVNSLVTLGGGVGPSPWNATSVTVSPPFSLGHLSRALPIAIPPGQTQFNAEITFPGNGGYYDFALNVTITNATIAP